MHRLYIIIVFLLFCFSAHAQPDSLKRRIQSLQGQEKLKALQCLTKMYLSVSPDSCVKYGSKTILMARELHDKFNEALANKRIGYSYYLQGEYEKSKLYYKKAYQLNIDNHDFLNAAEITNLFGDAYNQQGDCRSAIHYFTETEKSCDTLIKNNLIKGSVKKLYSILYTNIGLLYYHLDSVQKPLNYFRNALMYAIEIKDSTRIAASYSNIGMIYKKLKQFKPASDMYFSALTISRSIGDKHYECKILNNIANIYEIQGKIDSAMVYIKMSKKISTEMVDKSNISMADRNIARYFIKLPQYDYALIQTRYETGKKEHENAILRQDKQIKKVHVSEVSHVAFNSFEV